MLCPLQVVNKDMSWGCKSVGNPGYGSVLTSMFLSTCGVLICTHMIKPFDHYILGTCNAKANEKMNERCMNCWKVSTYPQTIRWCLLNVTSNGAEFAHNRCQMCWNHRRNGNGRACDGCCYQKCSSLNSVWYNLVLSTMELPPSHYVECIGSSSMNACPTGSQKICKVNNLPAPGTIYMCWHSPVEVIS